MDSTPPPDPFAPPPSIEAAVQEHLDVIHEIREMRREIITLAVNVGSISANLTRLANEQTVDRLTLGRVEKKLDLLLKHLGVRNQ